MTKFWKWGDVMQKISERIKYWGQLLLLPVYGFSFLFPRDKHIWLFGSTFGRRFADNPRYLYLYVSQHSDRSSDQVKASVERWKAEGHTFTEDEQCKDIRPIWISHDKAIVEFLNENGYEAYTDHSLKGMWYALRGKIYFFDNYSKDINFWQSGGAMKVNLWHGVGNKRINYDNVHDKVRHPKNIWESFKYFPRRLSDEKPSHYVLTTSPMMSRIFSKAFRIPIEHMIETGYPRNDILFQQTEIANLYTKQEEEVQRKFAFWKQNKIKVLAYIPTFRPSEKKFLEIMDLEGFNEFLKVHHLVFVCKLHPKSLVKKEFEQISYSNIYHVPADTDVNSFLGQVDLLVADYSSVYSDFSLLERPVVAFHYDYHEYAQDTREEYFDFDEYMPEKKAVTMEQLEQCILEVLEDDCAKVKRNRFRNKIYKDIDAMSSRRMVLWIKQHKSFKQ